MLVTAGELVDVVVVDACGVGVVDACAFVDDEADGMTCCWVALLA